MAEKKKGRCYNVLHYIISYCPTANSLQDLVRWCVRLRSHTTHLLLPHRGKKNKQPSMIMQQNLNEDSRLDFPVSIELCCGSSPKSNADFFCSKSSVCESSVGLDRTENAPVEYLHRWIPQLPGSSNQSSTKPVLFLYTKRS